MIPYPSPGLEIKKMNNLNGHLQHFLFLDNVRVPGDHLIGDDNLGWQVASTTLEQEHGGRGRAFPSDKAVDNLFDYVQGARRNGMSLGSDPVAQQLCMDAYSEARIQGLLAKRTYWMYQNRMPVSYEGNVADLHRRLYTLRNATRMRDVLGMYALLGIKEPRAPHGGAQEVSQRLLAGQNHAAGSNNIAKVILARRIGISRTRERAAPTPSTATSYGS